MSARSARLTLLTLGLLFFLPLLLAWLMYNGVIDFQPGATNNHGDLVAPPVEARLPEEVEGLDLSGHWIVLYLLPESCDDTCQSYVAGLRQVRRALGRDGERIRTAYLSTTQSAGLLGEQISAIDPAAIVFRDSSGMLRSQLDGIGGGDGTYVIDPLGNIMMKYHDGADPNLVRLDLKRILKYAKTDAQQ
jgi:hypothetical protein